MTTKARDIPKLIGSQGERGVVRVLVELKEMVIEQEQALQNLAALLDAQMDIIINMANVGEVTMTEIGRLRSEVGLDKDKH